MLINLTVDNLALISHEEIEFGSGLNILTGETGAGKSILLGALGLALGGKANRDMIRDLDRPALAEAVFSVSTDREREAIRALDIEPYEDQVILTRRINENRSIAKINGETVPSKKLKEAGTLLIDIYGQHEHQSLLTKKNHLKLLDEFAQGRSAGFAVLRSEVASSYQTYSRKKAELEHSSMDASERVREAGFLEQEIREIEEAELAPGEDETLEQHYRRMKNSEKIAAVLSRIEDLISADEGAADRIGRSLSELQSVTSYDTEGLEGLTNTLADIDGLLSDFTRDLADYRDSMEFDAEDFQQTEARLDQINTLKMRYGNSIEQILEELEKKKERLAQLQDYDSYIDQLKQECKAAESHLKALSEKLSEERKTAAKELTKQVTDALLDLNFLDVRFEMHFQKLEGYTALGMDDAEFYIALNPGEPLRPLQDTASGGELSRIMLALKTVLAEQDDIDTLIFDEIDTGISGRTAQKVSEKLAAVAGRHQVICITHLPQIASMADRHFLVEKRVEDQRTVSSIRRLSDGEIISELSRMLGGTEITKTVQKSAEEMRQLAEETKKRLRN